ncbi:hypothetical protein [Streptomyces ambofaciens]|uniref:Uncharacterized protein n=1 Tax=Streptomyces ambofaciens TaxID=1889 RepID=Q0JWF8_STRAM|nr:hypothetical protein [Streptomyces ambofaciens]CAK50970.1 hypothetical protein DSMT0127 [Streptomyces ambofaciens]CAK51208.1 hypothetical protein DSMT0127 [Streptomyces ambofaciens]
MKKQPGSGRPHQDQPAAAAARPAPGEPEHPLLRDVFPDLVAELTALLQDEGESELAVCARDLRLVEECGCGDGFCQSIRTADHPRGRPYGPGHRCVPLSPSTGMLILDVVDGRIVYIEVLDRPPLLRLEERAQPKGPPAAKA